MQLSKDTIEKLQSVFYSKDFNMASLFKFKKKIKELGMDIPNKQIEFFYNASPVVQIFKPYHKLDKKERKGKIINYHVGQKVYVDTMFISKYGILLVNAIDGFSRYAFSKAFQYSRSEDPDTNKTVTSKKAADALYEFHLKLIDMGYNIDTCVHDAGSEYLGYFKVYLEQNKIKDVTTDVGDKLQTSLIERLNYSMRMLIEKYVSVHGRKNLIGKIPQLVNTYNGTFHTNLKYTPQEVIDSPEIQETLQDTNKKVSRTTYENALRVGDNVRVYIKSDDDVFNKLSPNWSESIYKIDSFNKRNGKYKVNDKLYFENQLQKIDHVIPYDPKQTKEAKKKKRELAKIQDYLQAPKETTEGRVTRSTAKKNL